LHRTLLNVLNVIDYVIYIKSEYAWCQYECMHQLHQCKILIAENASDVAFKILPGIIKTTLEYEFVELSVEANQMLRNEYAKMGKTTPFSEYDKLVQKQIKFEE